MIETAGKILKDLYNLGYQASQPCKAQQGRCENKTWAIAYRVSALFTGIFFCLCIYKIALATAPLHVVKYVVIDLVLACLTHDFLSTANKLEKLSTDYWAQSMPHLSSKSNIFRDTILFKNLVCR